VIGTGVRVLEGWRLGVPVKAAENMSASFSSSPCGDSDSFGHVHVNGIQLAVAEHGPSDGPVVLLLHGFPELGFSWRHQVGPLAAAGYRVLVPDMRGYGDSDAPDAVEEYAIDVLARDVVGLLDHAGVQLGTLIGHDWGADVAWKTALLHPERVGAVAGLSVPFAPRAPAPPLGLMREHLGADFYMVWFQEPGVAEAALERDVRRTLATQRVWDANWAADDDDPPTPKFLTDPEFQVYVDAFTRTGFRGGLNYYRNLDRNWERTAAVAKRRITQPALFLTGERDPVRRFMPAAMMDGSVTDLRVSEVIPGAGHWLQQEAREPVTDRLLRWLDSAN
jgi:pimeloyl-ACP methyl ester carboxylesterase